MKISSAPPHVAHQPSQRLAAASPESGDRFVPSLRDAFEAIATPTTDTRIGMLADNIDAWNARWKLLESAQESIDTQYYTWDHDIFGKAQLGHVFHKARQGTDVRIMIDAVGDTFGQRGFKSHRSGQDYMQEVVALPNAECKVFHPHYKKLLSAVLHPLGLEGIAANHDKILEVDGRAASVGGRNTGNCYFIHPDDDPTAWRDADVLLEGQEAALELRDAIDVEYDQKLIHHKIRPDLLGNWKKRDVELLGAFALMDTWLKADKLPAQAKTTLRSSPDQQASVASELVAGVLKQLPALGIDREPSKRERKALQSLAADLVKYPELRGTYHDAPVPMLNAEVKIVDRTSALGELDELNDALLGLVNSAEKEIVIQSPYYVLTDKVIDALQDAGERGVGIKIATNSPSNTDSYFTQAFFLNDWHKSLATIPNLELFAATGQRKHHGKMAVIDDQVAVVGTYNLDLVSAGVNGEVAAIVWSDKFAQTVGATIDKDFADPTIGYVRYEIARDDNGRPVDAQGSPVLDPAGELVGTPEPVFGPENHVDPAVLSSYDKRIKRWNWAREHLPQLKSLRRFAGKD